MSRCRVRHEPLPVAEEEARVFLDENKDVVLNLIGLGGEQGQQGLAGARGSGGGGQPPGRSEAFSAPFRGRARGDRTFSKIVERRVAENAASPRRRTSWARRNQSVAVDAELCGTASAMKQWR